VVNLVSIVKGGGQHSPLTPLEKPRQKKPTRWVPPDKQRAPKRNLMDSRGGEGGRAKGENIKPAAQVGGGIQKQPVRGGSDKKKIGREIQKMTAGVNLPKESQKAPAIGLGGGERQSQKGRAVEGGGGGRSIPRGDGRTSPRGYHWSQQSCFSE